MIRRYALRVDLAFTDLSSISKLARSFPRWRLRHLNLAVVDWAGVPEMVDAETTKAAIRAAFAHVEFPGDWCLRGSNEGDEPFLLEREFAGKDDWRLLDADFLDQAPDGYASALSFFPTRRSIFTFPPI